MTTPQSGTGIELRPPSHVMRLDRLGAAHPTWLSFRRILLRRVVRDGWRIARTVWDIDAEGVGTAVYEARGPERIYSLVAFSHRIADEDRSDRVIAEVWDATFALFDGVPDGADLDRLRVNVPLQEAGRMSGRELTLSRANRSVRLFQHVVDRLAAGLQPDGERLADVGYLMRTTAVYGSGKFGLADRDTIAGRPEMAPPFQAEMLTVWLIRAFALDSVEHFARVAGGEGAVRLEPALRDGLGVGNSTGLGMAPFMLNHPVLIHNWFETREVALARARAQVADAEGLAHRVAAGAATARAELRAWRTSDPVQQARCARLAEDLDALDARVSAGLTGDRPLDALWRWAEVSLSAEGQERLAAIFVDTLPDGALDDLIDRLSADESRPRPVDPAMTLGALGRLVADGYPWALGTDWTDPDAQARLWYTSAEKLEPRLAERAEEPLEAYEQPLAPGRDVAMLARAIAAQPEDLPVGAFLAAAPEQRHAVRRVQTVAAHPYAEIQDNTISATMRPADILRGKLAFLGASRFDPRSDRWVRVTFFEGAPYPEDLALGAGCANA